MTFFIVHCATNPKRIIMDHIILPRPHQLLKRVRCEASTTKASIAVKSGQYMIPNIFTQYMKGTLYATVLPPNQFMFHVTFFYT